MSNATWHDAWLAMSRCVGHEKRGNDDRARENAAEARRLLGGDWFVVERWRDGDATIVHGPYLNEAIARKQIPSIVAENCDDPDEPLSVGELANDIAAALGPFGHADFELTVEQAIGGPVEYQGPEDKLDEACAMARQRLEADVTDRDSETGERVPASAERAPGDGPDPVVEVSLDPAGTLDATTARAKATAEAEGRRWDTLTHAERVGRVRAERGDR